MEIYRMIEKKYDKVITNLNKLMDRRDSIKRDELVKLKIKNNES